MRKTVLFAAVLLLTTVFSRTARAQDHSKESSAAAEESAAYRLDISFIELEDGKKLNTRHYSIDLTGGRPNEIKIGTRVPVVSANCGSSSSSSSGSASQQYQYLDLGTHIWAQLVSRGDELRITGDISSLDTSAGPDVSARLGPVIRQIKIEGSTAVVLGKPLIVGSADDPNSRREYQLEVTVTKLK
jgi:hypothetical protein